MHPLVVVLLAMAAAAAFDVGVAVDICCFTNSDRRGDHIDRSDGCAFFFVLALTMP